MKQHVARTALLFLIRLFPAIASLVALILFSRFTAPAFYGKYQTFWVQWQVLNTIACLGVPALIYTYPFAHVNGLFRDLDDRLKKGFFIWLAAMGILFALLQSVGGSPLYDPFFIAYYLISGAVITLLEAYLLLGRKYVSVAALSGTYAVFFVVIHLLFVRGQCSIEDLFDCLMFANLLRALLLFRAARKLYFSSIVDAFPLTIHHVKNLWFHLGLYDLIQVLFRWVDKLLLGFLLSTSLFAVYFNGTIDVPFLPLLLGAAGNALLMQLAQQDIPVSGRIDLLKESATTLSRIVFPVFFFLLLFRRELFGILFHHQYDASIPLFLITIMVVPLRAYNFTSLLQHLGKGRIINIGAALDLGVALFLMFPLYHFFSLKGVAFAFMVSTYFQVGFYLYYTARFLGVRWYQLLPLARWGKQAIVFAVVFIGLYYALQFNFDSVYTLFLGGGALVLTMVFALLPIVLAKRGNQHVAQN